MLKSNQGFSLIELVVVMAIVGVMMMIGIPQVTSYIAKAKRTEMRTNLAQIYSAQKSFTAEYSTYVANLNAIGYRPEGVMNYIYGFQQISPPLPASLNATTLGAGNAQTSTLDLCINEGTDPTANCWLSLSAQIPAPSGSHAVTRTSFSAYAAGAIQEENSVRLLENQ